VVIGIPSGVTEVEKRAVQDASINAGASQAFLIEEPMAAAIGSRLPVQDPQGSMIVDIGGGSTEAAVIALGGVVVSKSVRVGGNKIDEAIRDYLKKEYSLVIGEQTAEEIKIKIGSAIATTKDEKMEVSGRDSVFGLPRSVNITSQNITKAIKNPVLEIVGAVKGVLEDTPPELASDIIDKGIVMSGGTSLLRNLDRLLTEETGVPSHVAEDALYCVVRGTGIVLENVELWKRSINAEKR
jgi:rod shape-determining protein MreB